MRTTVDIPYPIYRRLKAEAAIQGCSVKELVLRGAKVVLARRRSGRKGKAISLPIIGSKRPGWLHLTNRKINEVLFP
jgi:hypothetical protein